MRQLFRWLCTICLFAATAQLNTGCGLVSGNQDTGDSFDGWSAGVEVPVCEDGELRLSTESCADGGRRVQTCRKESWLDTKDCEEAVDCAGTHVRETGEQCGDFFFNRSLEKCSGETWQAAGCSCGSENPSYDGTISYGLVDEQADVAHLRGVTFPLYLYVSAPVSGLEHILCVGSSWDQFDYAELPNLFAVDSLSGAGFTGLSSLRQVGSLNVEFPDDLHGLESLVEIRREFSIHDTKNGSLDALKSLQRVGDLRLANVSALESVEGLSSLTIVEGNISMPPRESLRSLHGFHNLKTIGGDLSIYFVSVDDFENLGSLLSIGGDVSFGAQELPVKCAAAEFFNRVSVGGEISGNGLLLEDEACD